jgi:hypothetical protein
VPIKHKQMSFVSNGGKFKLYSVLNGLLFSTPTQPRISFERMIQEHLGLHLAFKNTQELNQDNSFLLNNVMTKSFTWKSNNLLK